jgi:hypothetical protein
VRFKDRSAEDEFPCGFGKDELNGSCWFIGQLAVDLSDDPISIGNRSELTNGYGYGYNAVSISVDNRSELTDGA